VSALSWSYRERKAMFTITYCTVAKERQGSEL